MEFSRAEGGLESLLDPVGLERVVLDCGDVLETLKVVGVLVVLDMSEEAEFGTITAMVGLASKKMLMKRGRCGGVMVVIYPRIYKKNAPVAFSCVKEEERENNTIEKGWRLWGVSLAAGLFEDFSALLGTWWRFFHARMG